MNDTGMLSTGAKHVAMGAYRTVWVFLTFWCAFGASGQQHFEARLRKADALFERMAYTEARVRYEALADEGGATEHVIDRLADICVLVGDEAAAERWCAESVRFLGASTKAYRRYVEVLLHNGKVEAAQAAADQAKALGHDAAAVQVPGLGAEAQRLRAMSSRFEVKDAGCNGPGPDFAPCWVGNGRVVFSAPREQIAWARYVDAWSGNEPFDLYLADRRGDRLMAKRPVPGRVNSFHHDASASCDAASLDMYLTTNGPKVKDGARPLRIVKAQHRGDHWTVTGPIWKDDPHQSFHPALSADGRTLYFASDRPGGEGGTDIWVAVLEKGEWGTPRPLGPPVNTTGNEAFPFVDHTGALFFSSQGHEGLGGYDVYKAVPAPDGRFEQPIDLGAPLNSPADETGFIIDRSGHHGYFASDRPGGQGDDDIYAFTLRGEIEAVPYACTGHVRRQDSNAPTTGALVQLFTTDHVLVDSARVDDKGRYALALEKGKPYVLRASDGLGWADEQFIAVNDIAEQRVITRDPLLLPRADRWLRGSLGLHQEGRQAAGAHVTLVGLSGSTVQSDVAGAGGEFLFPITADEQYELFAELDGYYTLHLTITLSAADTGAVFLPAQEALAFVPLRKGEPIALDVAIEKGSDQLTGDVHELDLLAERLMDNPTLHVDVLAYAGDGADSARQEKLRRTLAAVAVRLRQRGVQGDRVHTRTLSSDSLEGEVLAAVERSEGGHASLFYTVRDAR